MNQISRFDTLFFSGYVGSDETIKHIFHRHFFVIIEEILLWILFAVCIPSFLYYNNVFSIQEGISRFYYGLYILSIYTILMYKLFDWYARVWIMTESTIIDMRWQWFAPNLLYIPYTKIEGIEVRTPSWIAGFFGMSDVVVKLIGQEEFSLPSASNTGLIVETLQQAAKGKKGHKTDEREPFDILVDTLSDVVKGHLTTHGKGYITRDYVEKLDDTLQSGVAIDLRTHEEKILIETWKEKYSEHADEEENDEHAEGHEKKHH